MVESRDLPSDRIEELLLQCLEDESAPKALERLCAEHPQHSAALRKRFQMLDVAGMLNSTPPERTTPPASQPEADQAGERFGEFELLQQLGRGGMGVVYLAEQPALHRKVALKVIRQDYLDQPRARERFRREVEAASGLDHPGICTVYEAGDVDGVPYIAMRYLKGLTLAQRLAETREQAGSESGSTSGSWSTTQRELNATLRLIEKVARALHVAHEHGLIHRDIKPGNILVTEEGEPVLLDFGLARPEDSGDTLTRTGDLVGTPAYMSPEQISSKHGDVDRRSDIYSLGITLFECLTLRLPFEAPTREQLYRQILTGDTPNSSRFNRSIPRDLQVVLATALEREPHRRYATALDLAEDLRRVRELEPIAARRPSGPERLWRWTRRKPLKAAMAVLLIVGVPAVAGLLGYIAATQSAVAVGEEKLRRQGFERQVAAGEALLERGHWAAARKSFERALLVEPGHLAAIAGLVRSDVALGELARAHELLDRQDQASNGIRRLRVYLSGQPKRLQEARREAGKIPPATAPEDLVVQALIKIWDGENGATWEFDSAYELLLRAILKSQENQLHHHLYLCHAATRLQDEAKILQTVEALETLFPEEQSAFRQIVWALTRVDPERALQKAHEFRKRWPNSGRMDAWVAKIHVRLGNIDQAIADYRLALQRGAANAADYHGLALLLLRHKKQPQEAEQLVREAYEKWPDSGIAACLLAEILCKRDKHQEGREVFEKAIAADRINLRLFREYGNLMLRFNELDLAETYLKKALLGNPSEFYVHFYLSRLWKKRGDLDKARLALERANKLDPKNPRSRNNLGTLLIRQGKLDEARRVLEEAIQLDPKYASAHYNLANLLKSQKEYQKAEHHYREAFRLKPNYAEPRCNLAMMIAARGRAREALPLIREGHRLGKKHGRTDGGEWHYTSDQWIRQIEALARREVFATQVLRGEAIASKATQLRDLARVARADRQFLAGSRAMAAAFEKTPALARDGSRAHRMWYAELMAQAGCGLGRESAALGADERAKLRDRALRLLQQDLRYWRRGATSPEAPAAYVKGVRNVLLTWVSNKELICVRSQQGLARLPAEERARWQQLWQQVRALMRKL